MKWGVGVEPLIVLSDIVKRYPTKGGVVAALDHISLSVEEGEFVSITGQSGSGKSTLMNILGCLDQPTTGEYHLNGTAVSTMKENQLSYWRNHVTGFIFQSFNLLPSLNALENVELPLIYRGLPRRERRRLAQKALTMVGLSERMMHKPFELSGGQQQRVAIARAIAAHPKLILADEPTGNLDSRSGQEIMHILQQLHQSGSTLIVITHDNGVAALAQRCIKIADGRLQNG